MNPSPSPDLDRGRSYQKADIKRQSVRGGAITLVSQAADVAIHLASTVVLARLLLPEEYGVMAMALAVIAFARLFRDLGLSSSTIQRDKLSHEQLSTLFWINVAAGTALTVIVAAASPLVAWFYQRPELKAVTLLLSLNFLINSFSTQQGALLTRQMRFGRKAVATLSGSLVSLTVSVVMAVNERGYWSLVFGTLSGALVTTVMLNSLSGWRPGVWRRRTGVRSMLKYGANITGFEFVNYFHRNLDNILIGRFWGADALGLYSRAYQLLMFPISNIRGPLNAVAFPAMSRLQNQPELFRGYYRRVVSVVALLSMPLCGFLFVAARPIIELALGSHWSNAAPLFQILAIVAFIQPSASLRGMVVMSLGEGKRYLTLGILQATFTSLGFIIGVRWGPQGIAISYVVSTYLILVPMFRLAFRNTPVALSDYVQAVARPFIASVAGAGAAGLVSRGLPTDWPLLQTVASLLAVFFVTALLTFVVLPGGAKEMGSLFGHFKMLLPARAANGIDRVSLNRASLDTNEVSAGDTRSGKPGAGDQ